MPRTLRWLSDLIVQFPLFGGCTLVDVDLNLSYPVTFIYLRCCPVTFPLIYLSLVDSGRTVIYGRCYVLDYHGDPVGLICPATTHTLPPL